jgi:hypothetical protein
MSPTLRPLAALAARACSALRPGPLAAAAIAALGACCIAPSPEPEDWLDVGYRGPEQTVRTFLTALAGDRPDLEYLCLSQSLKEREGGNLLGYLELRDQLLHQMPWLKAAARARIERVEHIARDRARVHARVDWLLWDETFRVDLVSEEFYEYWSGSDRLEDGYLGFAPEPRRGTVLLELPALEDADLDDVTEVRAGLEWKIDAFTPPEPEP